MKQKLTFFAVLMMAMAVPSAKAYDFSAVAPTGQTLYYNIVGNSVTVTHPRNTDHPGSGNTQAAGSLVIPDSVTYGGFTYAVTSVGVKAFFRNSNLTAVILPNTITTIEEAAFNNCDHIVSMSLGNAVTIIGGSAFASCEALSSITIPNTVSVIDDFAFRNCDGLTSVTIPNSVLTIGNLVFDGCSNLASVSIGNSVNSIGNGAFSSCPLTSVIIPNSVTTMGNNVFKGCSNLISVSLGNSVSSIGNSMFYGCGSLLTINLPNSVTSIGEKAFYRCYGLTTLSIPEAVTHIGDSAFYFCNAITSLVIGPAVSTIGGAAFSYCSALGAITSYAVVPPLLGEGCFYNVNMSMPVTVACSSVSAYQTAAGWSDFTDISCDGAAVYVITVESADETMGTVSGGGQATGGDTITIRAISNPGYHFLCWNDYNTESERSVVVYADATYTAYFAAGSEWIDDVQNNDIQIYAAEGRIVVMGAEGETVDVYDVMGRRVALDAVLPAGVYMVKVGDAPARKVVVVR